jgi:adenylyltransferase/sulfurtransferase
MSVKSDVQGFDISNNSAVVIGCGGLGTNVAVHLVGAGIGRLLLVDFDTVEERNLNRQFFYTKDDIGKPKCELLKNRLSSYAPDCIIDCLNKKVSEFSFAKDYDIIVIAVDNIETRKNVNDWCVNNKMPCINGSINGQFGMAYLCIPEKTPDLEKAGSINETGRKNLSPSTTAGLIGSLEAKLTVDYFLGNLDSAGKLYIFDNNEIHSLEIRSDSLD